MTAAGADLRRGAAEDLRDHQPRARLVAGGAGRSRLIVVVFAPVVSAVRLLVRGDPVAVRRPHRSRQPHPRGARGDRRRHHPRPPRRRGREGGPRPAARRARPRRPHRRRGDEAPLGDRDARRRAAAAGTARTLPVLGPYPAAALQAASPRTSSASCMPRICSGRSMPQRAAAPPIRCCRLRRHGGGAEALFRARDHHARRPDAAVPQAQAAFRAGGRRIRHACRG